MDRRRAGLLAALCLELPACTGGTAPTAEPTAAQPSAEEAVAVAGGCGEAEIDALEPFEVPADGGTVTALAFGTVPAKVGEELKIVWRVTGEGDLTVRPIRPDGSTGELVFGPEPHAGSNFSAPGDEWGTGLRLDSPGCWQVELARTGVTATLPMLVEDPGG
jgi:hypothetical protein